MPVQITPVQPNRLAELALNIQQGKRQDRRLDQVDEQIKNETTRLTQAAEKMGVTEQQFAVQLLNEVIGETQNPDQAVQIMSLYGQQGVVPPLTAEMERIIRATPAEAFGTALKTSTPAALEEFNSLTEGMSPEDVEQAKRVKVGLDPRAVTSAPKVTMIGGVPHIFDATSQTMKPVEVEGQRVTTESVAQSEGEIAATVKANEQGIEQSGEAIKQLSSVKKSISNIADAIQALDDGASTGAMASRLPSITQASIELDNVRAKMGLDVIGSTTFGALSESELNFALDTALPNNLQPAQLREWLVKKQEAQQKLAAELEGAAIFLGQPGNTPAKYLEFMRANGGFGKAVQVGKYKVEVE